MAKRRKTKRAKKGGEFTFKVKSDKQLAKDFGKTFKSGKGGTKMFKGLQRCEKLNNKNIVLNVRHFILRGKGKAGAPVVKS